MDKYRFNGFEYPPYMPPSAERLLEIHGIAEKAFHAAFDDLGLVISDYYIDFHLLNNALVRTDQRRLHYLMYHRGTRMNELKRIAVLSYWVLRFKPINRKAGGCVDINERVVLNWIFKSINNARAKTKRGKSGVSDRFKRDLLYSLTYRDISYDHMTTLIEALAEN